MLEQVLVKDKTSILTTMASTSYSDPTVWESPTTLAITMHLVNFK